MKESVICIAHGMRGSNSWRECNVKQERSGEESKLGASREVPPQQNARTNLLSMQELRSAGDAQPGPIRRYPERLRKISSTSEVPGLESSGSAEGAQPRTIRRYPERLWKISNTAEIPNIAASESPEPAEGSQSETVQKHSEGVLDAETIAPAVPDSPELAEDAIQQRRECAKISDPTTSDSSGLAETTRRRPGRPRKTAETPGPAISDSLGLAETTQRRQGRPQKTVETVESSTSDLSKLAEVIRRPRGRPRKNIEALHAASDSLGPSEILQRHQGRPRRVVKTPGAIILDFPEPKENTQNLKRKRHPLESVPPKTRAPNDRSQTNNGSEEDFQEGSEGGSKDGQEESSQDPKNLEEEPLLAAGPAPPPPLLQEVGFDFTLETTIEGHCETRLMYGADVPSLDHLVKMIRKKHRLQPGQKIQSIKVKIGHKVFNIDLAEKRDWRYIAGVVAGGGKTAEMIVSVAA